MGAQDVETTNKKPTSKATLWLVFTVLSISMGSSCLMGYHVGVLNAPQTIIGLWIRRTKCIEKGGVPSEEEGLKVDHELWCGKLDEEREATMFIDNDELNTLWALLNALVPGGSVIGALGSSFLVNRFGPKKSMLLNNVLAVASVLLNSLARTASSVEMLIVGRFLAGLNSGVIGCVTPTYLNEIAPDHLRGSIGGFFELSVVFAIWVSTIIGMPSIWGNMEQWPILLAVAAVPTIFQLATLPFCPDSPKYIYFKRQNSEETQNALSKLHGKANAVGGLIAIRNEYELVKHEPVFTLRHIILDPFLRRILLITLGLHIFQQFSGIDAAMFYSTAIFRSAGLDGDTAVYATIGMGAINVAGTALSLVLIEKAGRRILLLIGYSGCAIFLTLLTVSMLLYKSGDPGVEFPNAGNSFSFAAYVSSVSLVCFVVIFSIGPGAIPWILMSEFFAQGPRAVAAGPGAAMNRFGSLTVALAFPYMQAALGEYSFIIFIALNLLCIAFTYRYVVETKGKTTDEIQTELRSQMDGSPRQTSESHPLMTLLKIALQRAEFQSSELREADIPEGNSSHLARLMLPSPTFTNDININTSPAFTNDFNTSPAFTNDTNTSPAFTNDFNTSPAFTDDTNTSPAFTNDTNININSSIQTPQCFPSTTTHNDAPSAVVIKQEFDMASASPLLSAATQEEKPLLRYSVGPHPRQQRALGKSISCCDVSNDNVLALATDAVKRPNGKGERRQGGASDGWLQNLSKVNSATHHPSKRPFNSSADTTSTHPPHPPTSSLYICDLDRPWRLFPIFDLPIPGSQITLIKFSPCGTRLIVCDSSGCYYLLASRHSALNAWQLLHRGSCPAGHKFIYAAWTKSPQTFLYNPLQADVFFNLPGRPKIVAVPDARQHTEDDGFFVVTDRGLMTLVYLEQNRTKSGEFTFPTYTGTLEGEGGFVVADSIYDCDDNLFYLALANSTAPDVVCVKFPLPRSGGITSKTPDKREIVFETSTSLMGKNIFQRVKLIISSKVKYLLAATKSFDCDYLELWELSTDLQRDFLDSLSDPAIVPSDKPAWSMIINQQLPVFLTWSLPNDRFVTNDIDKSFTVSVVLRDSGIAFYTVKLGLEISITDMGHCSVPHPVQYVRDHRHHGGGVKRLAVAPEPAALVTSANGAMVYLIDTAARIWAFSLPHHLWIISHHTDLIEVLLTVELDHCDVICATHDAAGALHALEDVFHGFSSQQRRKSQFRYTKLKTALIEKSEGRNAAIVIAASHLLDVYLTFLEQFVDLKQQPHDDRTSSSSPLVFEIPELLIALRGEESTLDSVSAVIGQHLLLELSVLRQLLTGFHLLVGEIVELITLLLHNPALLASHDDGLAVTPAAECLPKIRLILALIASWTSSQPTLRQFWQRPAFFGGDSTKTVMDVLFRATVRMTGGPGWTEAVGNALDEAGLRSRNWATDWKRLYTLAETRAASLAEEDEGKPEHVEYEWSYEFLPVGNDGRGAVVDLKLEEETERAQRKYCSRCFFNFAWRPVRESVDTWHSHMRFRWKRCFCGGAWVFLS
ncbi:Solute carrier family 2, facilitated glucose transporter member 3 [Hypsibius exemplaris]|uniref:Solute carrier family 2, facilitated glucose transporter member 3 n=1 Tax=Hypsibius exemplaris TaxID=2072580 RepID=A0A1W0WSE6_HYPEX|nr:Solute carrier family 2, facilitated glucose transporter member 3 [Hypsibius exemplaris]